MREGKEHRDLLDSWTRLSHFQISLTVLYCLVCLLVQSCGTFWLKLSTLFENSDQPTNQQFSRIVDNITESLLFFLRLCAFASGRRADTDVSCEGDC
ncbi:hypothetical protein Peur_029014 [Populus x canadensis]